MLPGETGGTSVSYEPLDQILSRDPFHVRSVNKLCLALQFLTGKNHDRISFIVHPLASPNIVD